MPLSKLSLAAERILPLVLGQSFLLYLLLYDLSPFSFCVLTCPSYCPQTVSAPSLVTFFLCPDLSLPPLSSESEFHLLGCLLSVSWLIPPSAMSRMWVPLTWLLSFHVLTCPPLCHIQDVSAPHLVAFFPCPDLSLPLLSPAGECPLLSCFLSMSWLVSRKWVPLAWSLSFHILTCPSLCHLQRVSTSHSVTFLPCPDLSAISREWVPLVQLLSFCDLTCPSLCYIQKVSGPCSVAFFPCPDLSLPLLSLVCECLLLDYFLSMFWLISPSAVSRQWVPLAQLLSFCVLTCSSLCCIQKVSGPCSVVFVPCPDLSLPLLSPDCGCLLLGHFLSMSWLISPSAISREWVPLAPLLSFYVLTCPSLCCLQEVSGPYSVAFFSCPNLSLPLPSPVCECLLLDHFLSISWLISLSAVSREWVPLAQLLPFCVLTCPSLCYL